MRRSTFNQMTHLHHSMRKTAFVFAIATTTLPAHPQPAVDALSACLEESATVQDRRALARWIFISLAVHSDLQGLVSISPGAAELESQSAAQVFNRVVLEVCVSQAKEVVHQIGPAQAGSVVGNAFGVMAQRSMRALAVDKKVSFSMSLMQVFVDDAKLRKTLTAK
jgi:hypothetical protein